MLGSCVSVSGDRHEEKSISDVLLHTLPYRILRISFIEGLLFTRRVAEWDLAVFYRRQVEPTLGSQDLD